MSSLRRGHANLLCIVPILSDDPKVSVHAGCLFGAVVRPLSRNPREPTSASQTQHEHSARRNAQVKSRCKCAHEPCDAALISLENGNSGGSSLGHSEKIAPKPKHRCASSSLEGNAAWAYDLEGDFSVIIAL